MPHAIIRGRNGRRHEVDFGDAPLRVEIHHSEETVEIFIEADFETLQEEHRRFAILNIPRHLFSEATAATARRAAKSRGAPWACCEISVYRLNSNPRGFSRSVKPRYDLLTAVTARSSRRATAPIKNSPVPFPKRDSGIDGTIHPTVRGSPVPAPGSWPVTLASCKGQAEKRGGCPQS
jgi:hypothetical protein